MLQNHAWVKEPWKMPEVFIDMLPYSKLQLTFKKLVEFCCGKRRIAQLS